jgi:hypothetical protein
MAAPSKIASILAAIPLLLFATAGFVNKDWRVWLFLAMPVFFFLSLFDAAQRTEVIKRKWNPSGLLIGLSFPAFLLTHAEILTWGNPAIFIATNATGVVIIAALAFFRDKRDAKTQEIPKAL